MEKNTSLDFYDELSENYHLIFHDWYQAVQWQGNFFNGFIRSHYPRKDEEEIKLLDASCGIGTQSLGLAQHEFEVTATDLSPRSIERAKREAEKLGVQISFGTADFRTLDVDVPGQFEVFLSADNAVPHLLTDADLEKACRNFYDKLESDGLLVISIRDYDHEILKKQRATLPRVMDGGKRIAFQVWDWAEGTNAYITNQFIMQEIDGEWQTKVNKTTYRALLREELSEALRSARFQDIRWHMPAESGYYQPIVTARK
ncbi:class I SAM-dependent methyltransferase [Paenibacillus sp. KQZ6P-2]|uniref:Class I SAM-dependent methyltransferase n=1 Tax=Paenibacillus mangrovi TaxID=2931978 RepID=A0A9X2B3R4_9BACL|nr:class I SAM-dependent methyltransferase [Paenibacillus mangrovi]MCJ8013230.1 class I SAM-dependent methyltransferase [Paenibacillus mangrovi]